MQYEDATTNPPRRSDAPLRPLDRDPAMPSIMECNTRSLVDHYCLSPGRTSGSPHRLTRAWASSVAILSSRHRCTLACPVSSCRTTRGSAQTRQSDDVHALPCCVHTCSPRLAHAVSPQVYKTPIPPSCLVHDSVASQISKSLLHSYSEAFHSPFSPQSTHPIQPPT